MAGEWGAMLYGLSRGAAAPEIDLLMYSTCRSIRRKRSAATHCPRVAVRSVVEQ